MNVKAGPPTRVEEAVLQHQVPGPSCRAVVDAPEDPMIPPSRERFRCLKSRDQEDVLSNAFCQCRAQWSTRKDAQDIEGNRPANSTQKDMSFISFPFCNPRRAQKPNQPRLLSTSCISWHMMSRVMRQLNASSHVHRVPLLLPLFCLRSFCRPLRL